MVGKLIYLSHTKPDIAYVVSVESQFMHTPLKLHSEVVYWSLRYLKIAPSKGALFKNGRELKLEAYIDASWVGSIMERRSTTRYCTFLGGDLITWRSKRRSIAAHSSAEAEFRATAQGICEPLWIKIIFRHLKIKFQEPIILYRDNKTAINVAHNSVHHDRIKHVEVEKHFIKEKLDSGQLYTS